jgi:hippurate hydrolase
MPPVDPDALLAEMTAWRRDLHAHPEPGFGERRTARLVADGLRAFGLDEVAEGIGGTGVVGTLRRGTGNRSIALRADMDALAIDEAGALGHRSRTPGLMHACGHDGHTAMLLGAARLLAAEGGFDGTVRFVFQPAEEWGRGALAMLADGLRERFPFDEIYGFHNMPGQPVGTLRTRSGPLMAAEDLFEIRLAGRGGHAARPHTGREAMVAACALVLNLQTIVSRRLDPARPAVVSVTGIETDGTRNVLPGTARIVGDCRTFDADDGATIEREMRRIAEGTAQAYGLRAEVDYARAFVPLVNDGRLVAELTAAARTVLADDAVSDAADPMTASEDFARYLEAVPGCFAFVGNGEASAPLHSPDYDFDDAGLLTGARLHAAIVRRRLPVAGAGT